MRTIQRLLKYENSIEFYRIIPACAVAQCSVKDDFSSEGKTLTFDCSTCPNPVTDHNQT